MQEFRRMTRLPPYVFATVNKIKIEARRKGEDIIDLGMGNPDIPTPQHIVDKLIEAASKGHNHRYSASMGITSVHPETGDFQMLSDLASGSVRSDARQIHFSGALSNQINTN